MSFRDHPKTYGSVAVAAAFVAGALFALGLKDFYPDLEASYQRRRKRARAAPSYADFRRSSMRWGPVDVQDLEPDGGGDADPTAAHQGPPPPVCGIEGTIGNTPLVEIRSLSAATGRTILAKAEFVNGAGQSPKDRVALAMLRTAEARGQLRPGRGDTVYEGSVGSTGISLAALARARGHRAHVCMPDDQSAEKAALLAHLGATVERVPVVPFADPDHFVNLAHRRARDHAAAGDDADDNNDPTTATTTRGFFADQFDSPANWEAHRAGTGPEIYAQTAGRLDAFVAGAGTGGTISGVAMYLKGGKAAGGGAGDGSAGVRIVLADPQGSGLYNRIKYGVMYAGTEKEGTRRRSQVDSIVEGIGINRVTENLEAGRPLIDDAVRVSDDQACRMARWLVERDGIFAGSSSAVNCVAAVVTALSLPEHSRVVTVLCDSGTRHLSKFWKRVAEMGLEDEPQPDDLFEYLGIERQENTLSRG